jgi:ABC-type antimicrobial peptide transport system ATPase subunit
MMEKSIYQKKIIPYLDGSLSAPERAEFEAYVHTHPEFESQIRSKEEELALVRSLIPLPVIARDSLDALENEMRESILNLLREEPRNLWGRMKDSWEEWLSR